MNAITLHAQRAIIKGKLFEYLIGTEGHACPNPYADMPTYPTDVFASLVAYYQLSQNQYVWSFFNKSVAQVSASKDYAWLSPYYLVAAMRYSTREHHLDLVELTQTICTNLVTVKQSLLHDKRWVGWEYPAGLWGDVERMVRNINEEFGLHLVV